MKTIRLRPLPLLLSLLVSAPALPAAIPISDPPVPDSFPTIPAVGDWSTLSVGDAGVAITPEEFDLKVIAAADATAITTTLGESGTFPPSQNIIARRNTGANTTPSGLSFLQTRPTGNDYLLLLGTLVNSTGGPLNAVRVTYEYSTANISTENVKGLRAYFSLTGAPASWTLIPELSIDTVATVAAPDFLDATVALPAPLADAGTLYLLFADQNSIGTDASYHIRNFAASSPINCTITATPVNPVRLPGANPADPADDTVTFSTTITGTGNLGAGWRIASGPSSGTTGSYGATQDFNVPIADFTGGPILLRIEDQATPSCFYQTNIVAPSFVYQVTAMNSPTITFTPAAVGAGSYLPPADSLTEPGWAGGNTGGNTASNVQTQPAPSSQTLKYFHFTTNATLTTDPVDVSALKGGFLGIDIQLAFYSTSATGLDAAPDALNFRVEVALDGDFANTAGGNLVTTNIRDVPVGEAPAFGDSIAASNPHLELNTVGFPEADFTFHPFSAAVAIPSDAPAPRARFIAQMIDGITNSEHVLLDNIVFRTDTGIPTGDTDGDGVSDVDEAIMGTDPNDAADVLRLSQPTGNPAQITFPSKAGRFYRVYVSDGTAPATHLAVWNDSGLATLTGTGGDLMFTLAVVPGEPRRFYRLHVMQSDGPWPATFP